MFFRAFVIFCALLGSATLGHAAASDWIAADGGRVRVVIEEKPAADGSLRGALQIELKPGWKTYWRDPGGAGVPPKVTFAEDSGVETVELGFPAPQAFGEGDAQSVGYLQSVSLPLTLKSASPLETLDGIVFLGICEDICIPVQADFSVDLGKPTTVFQKAVVDGAFSALPKPARPGFRVVRSEQRDNALSVEVEAPPGAAELFLAADGAWQFGPSSVEEKGGVLMFRLPILRAPGDTTSTSVTYTLRSGEDAVEGVLPAPGN